MKQVKYDDLQCTTLHKEFDELQNIYGSTELNSIYGAGCLNHPDIFFVFMNPTGKNVASSKDWQGMRAQWLGTKNIWNLFYQSGLLNEELYLKIKQMKPKDWSEDFSLELYQQIKEKKIYITNLGKCTQVDAKPLLNHVFIPYLSLLEKESEFLNFKTIDLCFQM